MEIATYWDNLNHQNHNPNISFHVP